MPINSIIDEQVAKTLEEYLRRNVNAAARRSDIVSGGKYGRGRWAFVKSPEFRLMSARLWACRRIILLIVGLAVLSTALVAAKIVVILATIRLVIEGSIGDANAVDVFFWQVPIPFDLAGSEFSWQIAVFFGVAVVLVFAEQLLMVARRYLSMIAQRDMNHRIFMDMYRRMLGQELQYFDNRKSSEIIYLQTAIAGRMKDFVLICSEMLLLIMNAALVVGIMFSLSPVLTALLIGLSVLQILLVSRVRGWIAHLSLVQNEIGEVRASWIMDSVAGIRLIRQFGREHRMTDQFDPLDYSVLNFAAKLDTLKALFKSAMEFLGVITVLLAAVAANAFADLNLLSDVTFTVAYFYIAFTAFGHAREFLDRRIRLAALLPNLIRVTDFLTNPAYEVDQHRRDRELEPMQSPIDVLSIRNVRFAYGTGEGEKPALVDFSADFHRGELVAIVGLSGSGKSTLLEILSNTRLLASGDVTLDGRSIRSIERSSYRQSVGYVSQDPFLFHDTIEFNIKFAHECADQMTIEKALRQSCATDFIEQLSDGLDTYVGERGSMLSGGQRQRLAIARAFVQDSSILLLDEATSALDMLTESRIYEALAKEKHRRITIVAAHRLSAITKFDRILVMQNGSIIEEGNHAELLELNGLYASLFNVQRYEAE